MSLPKNFWDRLPLRTDADLLEMITHPADYEPEALEAIKAEWSKRNLPHERIVEVATDALAPDKAAAETAVKAREPLSWKVSAYCFIFGFTLLPVFAIGYYRAHGYRKKALEAGILMILGFISCVVSGTLRNCDLSR